MLHDNELPIDFYLLSKVIPSGTPSLPEKVLKIFLLYNFIIFINFNFINFFFRTIGMIKIKLI